MKKTLYCNPLDINYEYRTYDMDQGKSPICLEAADPVIVLFEDEYYLFSSITNGYWVSPDLATWEFIKCDNSQLPNIYNYAPAVMVMDGAVYFHQGLYDKNMYRSKTPRNPDTWELVTDNCYLGHDPFLFYDEIEDRVWASYGCGCGDTEYIKVVELDRKSLEPIGEVHECLTFDPKNHGWERGFDNHVTEHGWLEGSQILRHNNKWYLIYSGFSLHKSYANGVYISDNPTGPYEYAPNNPISHKNTGFIGGAGHGCLFEDKFGNWWNVTCASVFVTYHFERRINLFPAGFDKDCLIYVNTALADYPITVPDGARDHLAMKPPYMLLSKGRPVTVSSIETAMPEHPLYGDFLRLTQVPDSRYRHDPEYITDEDIRTLWAADSRSEGQWACLDLGRVCDIKALQLNIATYNVQTEDPAEKYHEFTIEVSRDGECYTVLADNRGRHEFVPHAFYETDISARYIKITFYHIAGNGFAALSGLRVFGFDDSTLPTAVDSFTVKRGPEDMRSAFVSWDEADGAEGYIVRYGISPDKLYNQYQVYGNSVEIRTLDVGRNYCFRVDSFNCAGVTAGNTVYKENSN